MDEKHNQDYSKDNGSRGSVNETDLRGDPTKNRNKQETALDESMQKLTMDTDDYNDDDFVPTAGSRPPPEPFAIDDYSEEDDAYDFFYIRRMPGFQQLFQMEPYNNLSQDVKIVLKPVEEKFLSYDTAIETQKCDMDSEDNLGIESNVNSDTTASP